MKQNNPYFCQKIEGFSRIVKDNLFENYFEINVCVTKSHWAAILPWVGG